MLKLSSKKLYILMQLSLILLISSCSSDKFLTEGEIVLSKVEVQSNQKSVKASDYRTYVRQEPNARWFNLVKVPLGIYCISGKDTTNRFNRFVRRLGEAPVIYDKKLCDYSANSLATSLRNKGYLKASVTTNIHKKNKKIDLTYNLNPGRLYYVDSLSYSFDNKDIESLYFKHISQSLLYKGMPFDATILDNERRRFMTILHSCGYYDLHREFLTYTVDTVLNEASVSLQLDCSVPNGIDSVSAYRPYTYNKIVLHENGLANNNLDSFNYHGLQILAKKKPRMQRKLYNRCISIYPDSLYSESSVQNTYGALNSLQTVQSTSIKLSKNNRIPQTLDCDIYVFNNKPNTVNLELEGTNTAGNFGAAASLSFSNNNLFRGAETLTLKARGAYEAITGLEGYNNQNYIEYNAEAILRFPTFMLPFITTQTKQKLKSTSEVNFLYSSQDRPEFHKRVFSGAWLYRWNKTADQKWKHRLDLFSLNYVFMPWISPTFQKEYLDVTDSRNSVLRYSYENLFIMRSGYNFLYNSSQKTLSKDLFHNNAYQVRFGFEMAGNLLYGISKLIHGQQDSNGQYSLFNIAYSQYIKVDADFVKNVSINDRNSFVFHADFGLAVPYGNSTIIPYEKRYFSGGANSVRGWSVRGLGPGSYRGKDGKIDFINQTGDIKLDVNLEYRTFLFWKLHAAAYVDAGNIWNTRSYEEQSGGQFKFDCFYKQIAVSYGLGIRFNFDYFILRFDTGMKAINPSYSDFKSHYPIINPKFSRDFAFHFAVGLPF